MYSCNANVFDSVYLKFVHYIIIYRYINIVHNIMLSAIITRISLIKNNYDFKKNRYRYVKPSVLNILLRNDSGNLFFFSGYKLFRCPEWWTYSNYWRFRSVSCLVRLFFTYDVCFSFHFFSVCKWLFHRKSCSGFKVSACSESILNFVSWIVGKNVGKFTSTPKTEWFFFIVIRLKIILTISSTNENHKTHYGILCICYFPICG